MTTTKDGIKVYCRHTRLAAPGELTPNPDNNRIHPEDQLEMIGALIRGLGWHSAVVVSRRSGLIVKGHGTCLAAQRAGLSQVPVEEQDYGSEAEELADLAVDNRIQEFSYQDAEKLKVVIERIRADGGRLDLTGYDDTILKSILQAGGREAVVIPIVQQAAPEQNQADGIKQVLLIYTAQEFMRLALAMQKISSRTGVADPSEAVLQVLRKRNESRNATPQGN